MNAVLSLNKFAVPGSHTDTLAHFPTVNRHTASYSIFGPAFTPRVPSHTYREADKRPRVSTIWNRFEKVRKHNTQVAQLDLRARKPYIPWLTSNVLSISIRVRSLILTRSEQGIQATRGSSLTSRASTTRATTHTALRIPTENSMSWCWIPPMGFQTFRKQLLKITWTIQHGRRASRRSRMPELLLETWVKNGQPKRMRC